MARPPIERAVGGVPRVTLFKPAGVPGHALEHLPLAIDELEAIRLVDLDGLSHEQAAAAMGVSRQTVGRVLEKGRARVAEALVGGKAILIGGGQYRVEPRQLCCRVCGAMWAASESTPDTACPSCGAAEVTTCWDPDGRCERGRGMGRGRGRGAGGRQGLGRGCGRTAADGRGGGRQRGRPA